MLIGVRTDLNATKRYLGTRIGVAIAISAHQRIDIVNQPLWRFDCLGRLGLSLRADEGQQDRTE